MSKLTEMLREQYAEAKRDLVRYTNLANDRRREAAEYSAKAETCRSFMAEIYKAFRAVGSADALEPGPTE